MVARLRRIVVGVAETHAPHSRIAPAGEDPVLASAAALAQELRAVVHVVRVLERPDLTRNAYTPSLHGGATLERERADAQHRLWAQTRRLPNAGSIHCHCVEGTSAIQLCAFAEEVGADLLVVGATRRGAVRQSILGSTAERVLRRARSPVLVMRHAARGPMQRVLLTTDLSKRSQALYEAALEQLEQLFDADSLELRTLLVCRYDAVTAARISREQLSAAAAARLRAFLDGCGRRSAGPATSVRIGTPSTEIIREAAAWKADLVVLGTHGRRGLSRLLLGSTAAATLRGLTCNALVIPAACAAVPDEQPRAGFPGTEEGEDAHQLFALV